jgi:membrane protease subunit HflC
MRVAVAVVLLIVGLAIAGVYAAAFIVHQNEQALVLRFGDPSVRGKPITQPGLHWKWPLIDTVEYFDRRILDLDTQAQEVTASDQKRIVVDAFARYRVTNPLLFYQTVRDERNVRSRLGPIMESALRRVLGAATFQELVRDRREELMHRIAQQVNEEGKEFGLEVVDVRIKRADLPEQNSKSVFERMRAERFREAAEFRAQGAAEGNRIKATADREATVIKAEASRKGEQTRGQGDAERNRIFAEAFGRDADFFAFYRSMQAYEQGLKSGDTRLVISPDSEFFRYFSNPDGQGTGTAPGSAAAAPKPSTQAVPPATAAVPQPPAQAAPPARP